VSPRLCKKEFLEKEGQGKWGLGLSRWLNDCKAEGAKREGLCILFGKTLRKFERLEGIRE
jgi:hypothetical protein